MERMTLNLNDGMQAALETVARNKSDYCRDAIEAALVRDGAILPRPNTKAQIVPVMTAKRFTVDFRSADGTLQTEQIAVNNEKSIFDIYSNIVKITVL
jgi:hypothetical protein